MISKRDLQRDLERRVFDTLQEGGECFVLEDEYYDAALAYGLLKRRKSYGSWKFRELYVLKESEEFEGHVRDQDDAIKHKRNMWSKLVPVWFEAVEKG